MRIRDSEREKERDATPAGVFYRYKRFIGVNQLLRDRIISSDDSLDVRFGHCHVIVYRARQMFVVAIKARPRADTHLSIQNSGPRRVAVLSARFPRLILSA